MTSSLEFRNVGLIYPGRDRSEPSVPVLDRVNLSVSSGEFVVIIGRSGSGKTSLLNIAAGFQRPTSGQLLVDGAPIQGPGVDRAVVFQDDALYPWLTAAENIAFPLKLAGVPKAQRETQVTDLLRDVGLEGQGQRRIWELSGGMRQRVGIARALASKPRFLLLDEPLGALDALTRTRLQLFLLQIWQASRSGALLITHSIEEALLLATRIVVLAPNPGRIAQVVNVGFGHEILAGASAQKIRQTASFRQTYDDLTDLIEGDDTEGLAA
ncbi:ABC transporter ATP-binding protein [Rhizobium lemnae]|uniref:Taurine ABC transporter ATP-binding protein n=1 Tax=Rhizobium lemnae TaxID=1214924 RepID=A0ABV8ED78_9HYPH|nr:ABC transporter ATP-binding protein [Rhizobium lemnae]MCJ8507035.1 ABC transporter ATP-binding protein [Rhizobium lemnae]